MMRASPADAAIGAAAGAKHQFRRTHFHPDLDRKSMNCAFATHYRCHLLIESQIVISKHCLDERLFIFGNYRIGPVVTAECFQCVQIAPKSNHCELPLARIDRLACKVTKHALRPRSCRPPVSRLRVQGVPVADCAFSHVDILPRMI